MHHYTKVGSGDKLLEETEILVCSVHRVGRVEDQSSTLTQTPEVPQYKCKHNTYSFVTFLNEHFFKRASVSLLANFQLQSFSKMF